MLAQIVDGVVDGKIAPITYQYCEQLAAKETWPRPTGERRQGMEDGRAYLDAVSEWRGKVAGNRILAVAKMVECVEAALVLPFDVGLEFEAAAGEECFNHPQSRALRHIFMAERRVPKNILSADTRQRQAVGEGADVLNRMRRAYVGAARWLAANGHNEDAIDAALRGFGFKALPFGKKSGTLKPGEGRVIQRRVLGAIVAEGARLLDEEKVARAGDIDAIAVHAMGFPRWRGGPMHAAQEMGLLSLRNEMRDWGTDNPVWLIPSLLDEAVKYKSGFAGLARAQKAS